MPRRDRALDDHRIRQNQDFAISREVESHRLYMGTAEAAVLNKAARDLLRDLAKEEEGHRTRLERMKAQLEEELTSLPSEEPSL